MPRLRIGLQVKDYRFLVVAPIDEDDIGDGCDVFFPTFGPFGVAWVIKRFSPTEYIKDTPESPLLRIPLEWAKPLYDALRDQFNYGEAERILRAELEVTKKHLEDMRTLVFGFCGPVFLEKPKPKTNWPQATEGQAGSFDFDKAAAQSIGKAVYPCPKCRHWNIEAPDATEVKCTACGIIFTVIRSFKSEEDKTDA